MRLLLCLFAISWTACQSPLPTTTTTAEKARKPLSVIFETDMGNDVDDALALDMLYKYMDQHVVKVLAISNNKNSDFSIPFLRIMNNWYGYPNIILGNVINAANSSGDSRDYAQAVYEYKVNGKNYFQALIKDSSQAQESISMYRQILSQQPDSSVLIISVGFSTNIARLLDSQPDKFSPLTGKELVAQKVSFLSMMAGCFNGALDAGEYNVKKDITAAKKLFAEWPTKLVASPFEVGNAIKYPATSIESDFKWAAHHPLVVAYRSYLLMPYDRPTWDLTSVLYAIEGMEKGYFGISNAGTISVDEKTNTHFTENANGKHFYLTVTKQQIGEIKKRFIELITSKPAKLIEKAEKL